MKTYQFHSKLTCDEVWYRMNVLLWRFSPWDAKRYEVRGELTEWGCFLWLRNLEGPGMLPVPLRLWTEERDGNRTGGGSLEYGSGRYRSWQFANPFPEPWSRTERKRPAGRVPLHPLFLGVEAAVWVVICCELYLRLPLCLAVPLCFIAAVPCALPALKHPLNNPGSLAIQEFLQTYLEEI